MRQLKIPKSFTSRNSTALEIYFQEISRQQLLSTEEEVKLAKRIKKGDTVAMARLVNANLRFVVSVAKQYQHRGLSLPDLISEGNMGLIKAAQRFDETKGFKFISYAVWWIRQSILNALNNQSAMIRIPLNKIGALNKIKKAASEFEQTNEREPTSEELSRELDFTSTEINDTISAPSRIVSLDAPLAENQDNNILMDVLRNPDAPGADDEMMKESVKADIERALSKLSSKESNILRVFFGINTGHDATLEEIGRSYNLSRERIRQLKERAIQKLRKTKSTSFRYALEGVA
ncbi:MAG: RNA polymerase sigma factor RpoD/SigA [Bacteroidota bacterium]